MKSRTEPQRRRGHGVKYRALASLSLCALCVLCVSILLLNGCDKNGSESNSESAIKLQLNWLPEPQFGGFYAAQTHGHFKQNGLNVEVVKGGPGTPTVQMVAAGTVPFGVASADEVVIARSNGADVVALFAVYQTNPQALMMHAGRNFDSIDDVFMNGGTVAMQRGLPYASFLEKKFAFDKVRIVPSPGGDLTAFRNDPKYTMQCFVTSEPLAAKKAGLDVKTFLVADVGYNPYTTVLVTNRTFLNSDRATVDAMTNAVRQGWGAYLADPQSTNAAMHKLNLTMDEQTFADSASAQKPLIVTDETNTLGLGAMTLERWETLCVQLADLGVVNNPPSAEECFISPTRPTTKP